MVYSPLIPFVIVDLTFSEPSKVLSDEVFFLICVPKGSLNKFSLVANLATLSNFANLHKSKMAAGRYLEKSTFDSLANI